MSEDCLSLNVWTPGVKDNGKRAVLVSFHGGGWATGSANGPMYDGGQLALLGDVVVVTVNHRLASFGYTHLASVGAPEEFKHAGVCGVMDMVASLEWVRDNIAAFGGDPSRVMIFGQSGGGSKTSTLLGDARGQGPVPSRGGAERIDAAASPTRPTRRSPRTNSSRSWASRAIASPTSSACRGNSCSKRRPASIPGSRR